MSSGRDDRDGRGRSVTDDDVLAALRAHPEPVATAGDLADDLGVTAETVRRHLSTLHEAGDVERKTAGARAVVWWVADDEAAPAAPLRDLVGLLDPAAAEAARERSAEWREEFDRTLGPES